MVMNFLTHILTNISSRKPLESSHYVPLCETIGEIVLRIAAAVLAFFQTVARVLSEGFSQFKERIYACCGNKDREYTDTEYAHELEDLATRILKLGDDHSQYTNEEFTSILRVVALIHNHQSSIYFHDTSQLIEAAIPLFRDVACQPKSIFFTAHPESSQILIEERGRILLALSKIPFDQLPAVIDYTTQILQARNTLGENGCFAVDLVIKELGQIEPVRREAVMDDMHATGYFSNPSRTMPVKEIQSSIERVDRGQQPEPALSR